MFITIVVVLILLGLALYAIRILPLDGQITAFIQILLIVLAIIYIANAAGIG